MNTRLLDRYIGQSVAGAVLAVMAVLVGLFALISFANEFDKIGKGSYTFWHALNYTLLRLPHRIYELFPLATLLGTMLGLGALANNSELVIMRTSGLSIGRIVISIMKTAFMLMLLAMVIGEVIAPPAQQYATQSRLKALGSKISLNTDYGLWARDGNTFINVRHVEDDTSLKDLHLYTFDQQHRMITLLRAKRAVHDGDEWKLSGVTQTRFKDDHLMQSKLKQLNWKALLEPDLINVVSVTPETLAVWKLGSYIGYLKDNGLDASQYQLAMWTKIMMPLSIAAMVLLAVPFVFGSQRHTSIGKQIMIGFLVGITFYIVNRLAGQMGLVYELPPAIAAALPTVVVISGAVILFRRLR